MRRRLSFSLRFWGRLGVAAWTLAGIAACAKHEEKQADTHAAVDTQNVTLTEDQSKAIQVAAIQDLAFLVEKKAVGSIDFDANLAVAVFTPYPGRIIKAYVDLGDRVLKGQALYTIESPDFLQAESTAISAQATLDQTHSALERARKLYESKAIDQNDYETAVANEQSADGALKAAREALLIFGKSPAEIDAIIAKREVEPALVIRSPITGVVTARNAAPGLLEQPGSPPAPYSVADTNTLWLIAEVTEEESPAFEVGQELQVTVSAYPDRVFKGKVDAVGANVDPTTHRVTVRSEIHDPAHALRAGMLANFVIDTGKPLTSPAVPVNGVVREGDGTMSVWVTTDRRHFTRRTVKIGLQQNDYDQILDGVKTGELAAIDGAIFLSNIAFGGPT
jgi:cobalt-zinc-cadmium efflux system membrane fusion protein